MNLEITLRIQRHPKNIQSSTLKIVLYAIKMKSDNTDLLLFNCISIVYLFNLLLLFFFIQLVLPQTIYI